MKTISDLFAVNHLRALRAAGARVTILCCLLAAGAPVPGQGQSPAEVDERAERYLDGYMMYNEGDRLEKEGNLEEALRKYNEASQVFDALAAKHPGWETTLIGMRRGKVGEAITRAQAALQKRPAAAAAPMIGAGVPGGQIGVQGAAGPAAPPAVGMWGKAVGPSSAGKGVLPSLGDFLKEYEQRVQQELEALQRKNLEMEGALRKWDDWYRWASSEIKLAREEKDTLAGRAAEMEGRVKQMQREVEAGRATQGQLDTLLKEKAALLALEKQNNERLAAAEKAAQDAAKQVTTTSAEMAALIKERDQLKAERDAAVKERDMAMATERKLASEIVELKKGRPDEEAMKKLLAENASLKKQVEAAAAKEAELRSQKEAVEKRVEELAGQMKASSQAMAAAPAGGAEAAENAMLREVILRQLRSQSRQQKAKSLVIEQLEKMEGASVDLLAQIRDLDGGRLVLTAEEEALFKDPQAQEVLRAGGGPVQAKLIASGDAGAMPEAGGDGAPPAGAAGGGEVTKLLAEGAQAVADKTYEKAVTAYTAALKADPKNVEALLGLGDAHQRAGQFTESEVALKKCLTYAPEDARAHHALGLTYYRGGRMEEAMAAFEASLAKNGKQAMAHHYLGIIASRLKQGERAEKEFRAALALDPQFGEAHFNLAVLYVSWSPPQLDKARAEYQSALGKGVSPDDSLAKLLKP